MRTFAFVLLLVTSFAASAEADDLRVMSFNIRYVNPNDGENTWDKRRELVFKTIETFRPDLLGMQEVTPLQWIELRERLKEYADEGLPRDDGKRFGERAMVMFKRERFEKVRGGTFWLSQTPDVVGSKGWDADLPRVCSWVELRDKQSNNRPVFFFNTHWDHKGVQARLESAKLMKSKVAELAGDHPVIIAGDFNSVQNKKAYIELLDDRYVEAFGEAHPSPAKDDFTFHGFTGKNDRGNDRIDWILRNNAFKTKSAEIDRTNDNGRYPSDHFPITAVFEWTNRTHED
jgi:endonuclease/exonuclease/phosphatase family metal-dependent hydrolase